MKKIVIISQVYSNGKLKPLGDGVGSGVCYFWGKSFSRRMRDKLNKEFKESNLDYIATIDESYEIPKKILENGADMILISPFVKEFIDLSGIEKIKYYEIGKVEYDRSKIEIIIEYLN